SIARYRRSPVLSLREDRGMTSRPSTLWPPPTLPSPTRGEGIRRKAEPCEAEIQRSRLRARPLMRAKPSGTDVPRPAFEGLTRMSFYSGGLLRVRQSTAPYSDASRAPFEPAFGGSRRQGGRQEQDTLWPVAVSCERGRPCAHSSSKLSSAACA